MEEELYNILSSEGKDEKKQGENENLKQNRQQRKIFGYCIFAFMCVYMIIAISIVFLCGWNVLHLSDKVIITLISSTLIEVIGIFNFVARYLFHKKD